jgi:lipopolysaccharide export system permease protein
LSLAIAKLSTDYELIVMTSFGLNPLKLIKHILIHLVSVTVLLLLISIILIPKANYLNSEFLEKKKSEAQFNINPSEFGQKFGDWFIYVNGKKENTYSDIVLFKNDKPNEESDIIIANSAKVQNVENNNLALDLYNGKAFYIKENVKQIDFNNMTINNKIERIKLINTFDDVIKFWKRMTILKPVEREFTFNVLYSIFPLISILFIISIGYFNPRYDKNYSTVLALTFITVFVVIGQKLSNTIGIITLYTLPFVWLLLSGLLYRLKVKNYY